MLGQLNNLKELEICNLYGVRIIDNEFYGSDSKHRTFFPRLENFVIRDMINLEQWNEITTNDASSNVTIFPNLKRLEITRCPKLLNIPDTFGGCDENDVNISLYQIDKASKWASLVWFHSTRDNRQLFKFEK
ncbi:unnamed protein product [Citrullus colocynthis]|uniref:Uncharacterized protein n=1 Tax=Citrullus colocynthis TaxID=252529 RepID=A0ABP0Y7V4_9ROSI